MELWIRSQDRNVLMPINSKLELLYDAPENILIISANIILGAYKSRQRVLEVLDEIQKYLKTPKVMVSEYGSVDYLNVDVKVYEMPQE